MNSIESGIDAGRLIFDKVWIEEALEDFINNLSLYQYEWDDKLWQFKKSPIHDFTSHDADTFRYMATIYQMLTKVSSQEIWSIEYEHEMDRLIFEKDEIQIDFDDEDNPY